MLAREASLAHYVSQLKHVSSLKFACADNACAAEHAHEKISIDVPKMLTWLNNTERYWEGMRRFAESTRSPRSVVTYTELEADPQAVVTKLFRFLGVSSVAVDTNQTVKMGALKIRDSIKNADEVADALRGTPYAGQVERELVYARE